MTNTMILNLQHARAGKMNGWLMLIVILCCLAPQWMQAQDYVWTERPGLPGGDVIAMKAAPSDASIMYVVLNGGEVYQSIDNGENWNKQGETLPVSGNPNFDALKLRVDPQNPSTLYFLTRSAIYKSIDGGMNWISLDVTGLGSRYTDLVIDPDTPLTLYFSSFTGGVSKSIDGGANWVQLNINGLGGAAALAIDPQNSSTIYCHDRIYFHKSSDGGVNWSRLGANPGNRGAEWGNLIVDSNAPATIYFSGYRLSGLGGVYSNKSTDGGLSWERITYRGKIVLDPANPGTLYAVGGEIRYFSNGLRKSTDDGASWSKIDDKLRGENVNAAVLANGNLFTATDLGVYKSRNAGTSWRFTNNGMNENENIVQLVFDPLNPNTIYGRVGYYGLFKSLDGGSNWQILDDGPRSWTSSSISPSDITVDPLTPTTLYGIGGNPGSFSSYGLYKSTDGGLNWFFLNDGFSSFFYPQGIRNRSFLSQYCIFASLK